MPRPKVLRIGNDELVVANIMNRRTGKPIYQGTFTMWLTDLAGNVIPDSSISLVPEPDANGAWRGLFPNSFTSTLVPNKRYILHYQFVTTNQIQINGRTEIEAIYNHIE